MRRRTLDSLQRERKQIVEETFNGPLESLKAPSTDSLRLGQAMARIHPFGVIDIWVEN